MIRIGRTPAVAILIAALAGCASTDYEVGARTPSPPPSPPPGPVGGGSSSGGTVDGNGFLGTFRGPHAALRRDGSTTPPTDTLTVAPKSTPGSPDDVLVTITASPTPGGSPTLTLTYTGESTAFDLGAAQSGTAAGGFLETAAVTTSVGGVSWEGKDVVFNFDGESPQYSRLVQFQRTPGSPAGSLDVGFMSYGADAAVTMPTTGSATYDTGVTGLYQASQSGDFAQFVGRADVAVSFRNGTVDATFADVDFLDASGGLVETAGGADFGLVLDAEIIGDDFAGTMSATGLAMTGEVQGDFYGSPDNRASEIGGAFAIDGAGGLAVGGLQGVCTCMKGTE